MKNSQFKYCKLSQILLSFKFKIFWIMLIFRFEYCKENKFMRFFYFFKSHAYSEREPPALTTKDSYYERSDTTNKLTLYVSLFVIFYLILLPSLPNLAAVVRACCGFEGAGFDSWLSSGSKIKFSSRNSCALKPRSPEIDLLI